MALTFRLAAAEDVPAVAALIERGYRQPDPATAWTDESALLSGPRSNPTTVARMQSDERFRFVLAEDAGVLVGSALIERTGDGEAHFGMFAIEPARQGGGVGRQLLAESERMAAALWSTRRMSMHVISVRTELIDWYVRRGYARTGESHPFPFAEVVGALRTDFDLVELAKVLEPGGHTVDGTGPRPTPQT